MLAAPFHICTWVLAALSVGDTLAEDAIVVAPLEVEGPLADTWRERLSARLVEGVERSGRTTLGPDRAVSAGYPEGGCTDASCWAKVAAAAKADYVIRPTITVDGRDFDVKLRLLDGESGAELADSSEVCEVCAVKEVGDVLAAHAGILSEKLDALIRSAPVIAFESTPPGAVIYLDGKPVGEAPLQREVTPGSHRARAEKRGYVSLERQIEAVSGTEEQVVFDLQRTPRAQRVRLAGWALLAVGIPATAAGVTLLVLDERPYRNRCSGDYVDEFGNCRLRYDTLSGGIALTSIGVASLVAGAVIIGLGRRRARERPVQASVLWNDSTVGLAAHGRF